MPASRVDRDVFRAPTGAHDVLPPESDRWQELVAVFAQRCATFGYGLVVTPIFEHLEVFLRVGASTDVVTKEMYELTDKGGRALALRPEGTAPVVRAFVQHRPVVPWKVWYVAPNFRYERPQKGRYRQHHQLGVEALGVDDPEIDIEVIALADGFLAALGCSQRTLVVNSMGDTETRDRYTSELLEHWRRHADVLGDEIDRAEANPLRILDSKRSDWHDMIAAAPPLDEHLSSAAADHFARVREGLSDLGIDHELDVRLVRGFDYYTSTAFEFRSDALDAAQNAIGGGGRYDRLAEEMGGPATPGIGFAIGVERLLLALGAEVVEPTARGALDVFVVDALGDARETTRVVAALRAAGLRVDRAFGGRSVRKQWSAADRSGAAVAVMLAAREQERGHVVAKDLRSSEQTEVPRGEIVEWLRRHLEIDEGQSR